MTTPSLRSYILGKSSGRQHGGATPSTVKAPCWVRYSSSPEGCAPPSAVRSHEAPDGEPWRLMINGCFKKRLIPDFRAQKNCFTPFSEEFYGRSSNEIVKKKCGWKGIFLHHYPIPVGAICQQIRFFPSIFKSFRYQQRRCRNPYKAILGMTFPLT